LEYHSADKPLIQMARVFKNKDPAIFGPDPEVINDRLFRINPSFVPAVNYLCCFQPCALKDKGYRVFIGLMSAATLNLSLLEFMF